MIAAIVLLFWIVFGLLALGTMGAVSFIAQCLFLEYRAHQEEARQRAVLLSSLQLRIRPNM